MSKRAKPEKNLNSPYVSKGGLKLEFALKQFKIEVNGFIAADYGSHKGGFVDCLLQNGVTKIYSIDTCYGTLDWKLRNDKRVILFERTNVMYWRSPEKLDIITIDVAWTKHNFILDSIIKNIKDSGIILFLLKPQYEIDKYKKFPNKIPSLEELENLKKDIIEKFEKNFQHIETELSSYKGSGGNNEIWFYVKNLKKQ